MKRHKPEEKGAYRRAIQTIALNDGAGDKERRQQKHVSEMVSVAVVAEAFRVSTDTVARAVIRVRYSQGI